MAGGRAVTRNFSIEQPHWGARSSLTTSTCSSKHALGKLRGSNSLASFYAHPLDVTVGQIIAELEIICAAGDAADMRNHVQYVPM